MDAHALTIKTVRDGPVCALVLIGDLDLSETSGFLVRAALAVDEQFAFGDAASRDEFTMNEAPPPGA